jgi:hypothetical protein
MTSSTCHRLPLLILLMVVAGFVAGCATHSARPGTVCGHCDYRFGKVTPNPCDPCVPEVMLPGYGHTPTSWQVWPEGMAHSHIEPAQPSPPLEEVPGPTARPLDKPVEPMPPTSGMTRPLEITAEAMPLPDFRRPRTLLR